MVLAAGSYTCGGGWHERSPLAHRRLCCFSRMHGGCGMTKLERLIALRREHLILAEGLGIEIEMARGCRYAAECHKRAMYRLIAERNDAIELAEFAGVSYFEAAGEVDALRVQAKEKAERG